LERSNPYPPQFDFREMPFNFGDHRREIERLKPDVVLLFLHLKNTIIWPLIHWLKLKGIPVVYWNRASISRCVTLAAQSSVLLRARAVRCDRALLPARDPDIRPANRRKVFVANNTVNFEAFPRRGLQGRTQAGVRHSFKKVVLFVGRMRTVKKSIT